MSLPWIIVVCAVIFVSLAVALLVVVPVQRIPLWMLSIGATEYGHWFAFVPLAVFCLLFTGGLSQHPVLEIIVAGASFSAFGLFTSTVLRALPVARVLPQQLAAAFGKIESGHPVPERPFDFLRLWGTSRVPTVLPEKLTYAKYGEQSLSLYFYRSQQGSHSGSGKPNAAKPSAPCILIIHTGGWNGGTPDEFIPFNHWLCHNGYAVAAMEYRLAPHSKWPAQREDVLNAITFLKANSVQLGLDGEQFVILGRSAGGHLAQAAAYTSGDPAIRGCIAFYAPADMHLAYKYSREDDILKSQVLMHNFLGGTPTDALENYNSASSILHVSSDTPPTLLLHGTPDPMVWHIQSQRLAAALTRENVRNFYLEIPWGTHAFDYNPHSPGGQLSAYAVAYFLKAVLRRDLG
jgi:acetyl esterase/lipase